MEALADDLNRESELGGGSFDHYAAVPLYPGNDPFLVAARVGISQAAEDVLIERRRQGSDEGWTPEHDDAQVSHELAEAAAGYAIASTGKPFELFETIWPWEPHWFRPSDPRWMLVKAGALIIAEIERLDRAATQSGSPEGHSTEGAEVQS
jgi:hypothetical protein